jgi:hypothetical protein
MVKSVSCLPTPKLITIISGISMEVFFDLTTTEDTLLSSRSLAEPV